MVWGSQDRILAHAKCSTTESNNGASWDGCKQSPLNFCCSQNGENPAIKAGDANSGLLGRARSLLPAQVAVETPLSSGHSWLTCWPQPRLQTGMRGDLGKPRAHSGQSPHWLSHHVRPHRAAGQEPVIVALRGANLRLPGCRKSPVSESQGFTKFNVDELENVVTTKQLIPDGCGVKLPLTVASGQTTALHSWEPPGWPSLIMPTKASYFLSKKKPEDF